MIGTVPDVDLIGGLEKRQIGLLPYDPAWGKEFETERRKVLRALGLLPHGVGHVGSTSVPGLAGQADHRHPAQRAERRGRGYLRPPPGVRWQTASPRARPPDAAHGIPELPSAGVRRRERLGVPPPALPRLAAKLTKDRRSYDLAKRALARQDWPTMNHYADAKREAISAITTRAEAWAAEAGWSPYSQ